MEISKASKSPFIVMVKPVGSLCNLSCSYCYYISKHDSFGVMDDFILERFTRTYIESSPGPIVNFIWHGGEPTLAGIEFFEKAVELQQKYLPDGWRCWNNLQTNGVLLDDRWCRFLSKHSFDVGISIDGIAEYHDYYRKNLTKEPTYEIVGESITRLKEYGIKPDLLCTVNSKTVKEPLKVYRALREFNTGWIQFIPIVKMDNGIISDESVNPKDFGDFLCEVFDRWVLYDYDTTGIQLFTEMIRITAGGSAALCNIAPTCGRAVVIESDGKVYSCDHFTDSHNLIGDIRIDHLSEIVDGPKQNAFGMKKQAELTSKCQKCQWLKYCNSGCPKDRIVKQSDDEKMINYLCEGYMRFISYVKPVLELITSLQKKGKSPQFIMNILQDEVRRIWKNISRNDPCPCGSGKKAKNCCWHKKM